MKALIYVYKSWVLNEESIKQIVRKLTKAKVKVVFVNNHQDALREVEDAEVFFGDITPQMLKNAKKLRWIQAPVSSMGLSTGEYYIFPELTKSKVILTNMSGIYNDAITDHIFAFITCFARSFPRLIRNQIERTWDNNVECRILAHQTIGIVGLGGIGTEVARRAVAFDMNVIAIRAHPRKPRPAFVKKVWGPKGLKYLLKQSDFIVLCLPHAPGTVRLIGREELKMMKKNAYLINIGRGITIDTDALVETLKNKEIAGAGLDVFEPWNEPLPKEHPLWQMENVFITPHCAAAATPFQLRATEIFLDNFDHFIKGDKLVNVVDKKKMITT